MADRPDWLPKEWTHEKSTGDACDFCEKKPEHFAIGPDWSWDKYFRWCDSPSCEERARDAITGPSS